MWFPRKRKRKKNFLYTKHHNLLKVSLISSLYTFFDLMILWENTSSSQYVNLENDIQNYDVLGK